MHLHEQWLVRVLLSALRWHLNVPLTIDDILYQMNFASKFIWNKGYLILGINQKTIRTTLQVFKICVPSLLSASAKNKLPRKLFHMCRHKKQRM